jgi:Tol biopolymer transport system component
MKTTLMLGTTIGHRALARLIILALAGVACLLPRSAAEQFSDWSAPVNLGPVVNSVAADGCPAISRDGLSLYFASRRNGGQLDIYVSERESQDDPWGEPKPLGPNINTFGVDDFCPMLSIDSHTLFFASTKGGGCGGADIYFSHRQDKRDNFGWGPAQDLDCTINSSANDFGEVYFEIGDTAYLYFNSDRQGGQGANDIYSISRTGDGPWSTPIPVSELNSPYSDLQPAVRRDGLEVIFSSTRPGGFGSTDLWVATRNSTSEPWGTPTNLGPIVNSAANENRPTLSWDGTKLYFSSSRSGTFGSDDLWVTTREKITDQVALVPDVK